MSQSTSAFEEFSLRIVPWWSDGCVKFLNNLFKWYPKFHASRVSVLEFGGGNSTIFFVQKGFRVVTVEADAQYVDMLVAMARRRGYAVRSVGIDDYCSSVSEYADLTVVHAPKSYPTTMPLAECPDLSALVNAEPWSFVVNDGIARKQVMEAIAASPFSPVVIVDNVEYCANWGRLDVTSAKPDLIKEYRKMLRSAEWRSYVFEQPEGRSGHGVPDVTGWESGHRWASAVLWRNSHILNRLMVTNMGFPLVNKDGEYDSDIETLESRCPFDWERNAWVMGRYPAELDLGLERDFD